MLFYLLLALVVIFLFIKYSEYKLKSAVVHAETGKALIFVDSYFSAIYSSLFDTISKSRKGTILHNQLGSIYGKLNFFKYSVSIRSAESAKIVLSDSKTYIKPTTNLFSMINVGAGRLLNPHNVVFVNGDEWKRQRKSVNPGFYDLSIYAPKFMEKSKKTIDLIKKNPIVADIHDLLQKMTLDILGSTIFHHEFGSLEGSIQNDLLAYNEAFSAFFNVKTIMYLLFTKRFESFSAFHQNLTNKSMILVELVKKVIDISKEKLKNGEKPTSMLDFMVVAHEDGELSLEELEANSFAFFIAGHETTANALSFAIQLLAKDQKVQEKARKEITEVLGNKECDFESSQKLNYLSLVIKETMRLFSPAPGVGRTTTKDVILEGYKIPKGTSIFLDIYAMHHSVEIYENPEEFIPERFENNNFSRFTWLPFSVGSRTCVGNNFALVESKIFLAYLLQNFKFKLKDENSKIEEASDALILGPKIHEIVFEPLK
eukprot:gene8182-10_t